jgi:hypothetical protein
MGNRLAKVIEISLAIILTVVSATPGNAAQQQWGASYLIDLGHL